jgi:hypothetical protein
MVAKRATKASTGKKLNVKKETIKDLSIKGNGARIKGGYGNPLASQPCTQTHRGGA